MAGVGSSPAPTAVVREAEEEAGKRHPEVTKGLGDHQAGRIEAQQRQADRKKLCNNKRRNKEKLKEGGRALAARAYVTGFFAHHIKESKSGELIAG
jgi:hypothetical protein